ncbi:MAG: SusC/RagA family TonB-linked outer membrane protein [Gemmatimonadaceae bacterium]
MSSLVLRSVLTAASLLILATFSTTAGAQATGRIRGTITEAGTLNPVSDAQVSVVGAQQGAVTAGNGRFTISNVQAGSVQIRTRKIGFAATISTVVVPAGGEVVADISIRVAPTQLNEVVVTGTPGATEKRALGNAVAQIDVADIMSKASITTVTDALQGRTPGVMISVGSGSPGTSSDITLRGYGSFTNNRPVIYIDGLRMDTEELGQFTPSGSGVSNATGQRTSALDLINPQDIESIEIVKGPAAAALYGADAAGGVIQIITKKGLQGQQGLRWSTRFETGYNEWGVETLTNYATCTAARIAARDGAGNPTWSGCQGLPENTILVDDPLRRDPNALRKGSVNNLSMSVRGGGDRYSFYISGDGIVNSGVLENNYDRRRSVRTNFAFTPNSATDFAVNIGYVRQSLRLPLGDDAFNGLLLSATRGIPGLTRPRASLAGWGSIEPSLAHLYDNSAKSDRLTIGSTVNYAPISWWKNRITLGLDLRMTTARFLSLPGDPDTPSGLIALRSPKAYNYTLDYAGTVIRPLRQLESRTSFGTQISSRRDERIDATGAGLPTREITTISSALSPTGANSYSAYNAIGIFVQEQLGFRNRLFVSGTLRTDDHSSFGSDFNIVVYPKASVSWVLSEEPAMKRWVNAIRADNFRFRGAWGRAGRAPAPYSAIQTYGATRVALGPSTVGGAFVASNIGNPNLRPEKGQEVELGFDSDYFRGRAGIDFTWYRKVMTDLFVPITLPPSLGFAGSMIQNLGQTTNSGREVALSATPLKWRNFNWDTQLNLSWNKNRIDELDTIRVCKPWAGETGCPTSRSDAEDVLLSGATYSPGMQRNRVGYPLGSYFSRYPKRDAAGSYTLVRTSTGVVTGAEYETEFKYVGPAVPTRMYSLSNTLTIFRNFRLHAMLDYQGGHFLYNHKSYNRCATVASGPNCARLNQPEDIGTARLDTLRAVFGGASSPLTVTSPMGQALYVEKADFIKLRDVSLSYTVPRALLRRLGAETATIGLVGRNLALWSDYSGLDPEVNTYSNAQIRGSGNAAQFVRTDAYAWPMIKRYTIQVNLTY